MLTQYEAQKVRASMQQELGATDHSVWASAAGLVTIVLLALIG